MGETTGIDWCDATFNPWIGCSNVSAGCGHCYAKTMSEGRMGIRAWYDEPRHITKAGTWKLPLRWAARARDGLLPNATPNEDGHRPRVFCASMSDVFEELPQLDAETMTHYRGSYPTSPRDAVMDLIVDTPELDWLLLTKRPEFARDWLAGWYGDDGPLANLWLGTSIENAAYTWRADVLRQIPAVVHFISAEPLLGSLYPETATTGAIPAMGSLSDESADSDELATPDLASRPESRQSGRQEPRPRRPLDLTHIEWVIVGGESGPGYRPMNVEHAREIRDHIVRISCGPDAEERPAFFFKQHGGPTPKAGGKLLDGREWCEFPEPSRDLIPA